MRSEEEEEEVAAAGGEHPETTLVARYLQREKKKETKKGDDEKPPEEEEEGEYSWSLEELDLKIIRALQEDARSSFRDVARKIGVAVGTVQSRVKRMEEANVIRGFSIDLDYARLGLGLTALILVQIKGKHIKDVEAKFAHIKNVCAVYDVTGEFDVAIVAKFKGASEMDRFIKGVLGMDYVERTVTSIVLNSVKEDYNIRV